MSRKTTDEQMISDLIKSLKESFAHWSEIKENGTRDPFWPDGVNLNIVRNHILNYKEEIERLSAGQLFPPDDPILSESVPPEMPPEWMAKPRHLIGVYA